MSSVDYVKAFLRRHGHWMMAANVVTKLLGFAAVVFVTRNTTEGEYGAYSFAMNLVGAVVPFMGLGAYQAFLRYASDASGQRAKKTLFAYAFSRGVVASLGLIVVLQLLASTVCGAIPESVAAFRIVAFVVLTTLIMEYVKSYARAMHLNHISARIDVTYALILVTATVGLTLGMGILGTPLRWPSAPLLAALDSASRWACLDGDGRHLIRSMSDFGLTGCSPPWAPCWPKRFTPSTSSSSAIWWERRLRLWPCIVWLCSFPWRLRSCPFLWRPPILSRTHTKKTTPRHSGITCEAIGRRLDCCRWRPWACCGVSRLGC